MARKFFGLLALSALVFGISQYHQESALGDFDDDDFGGYSCAGWCAPACQPAYRCDFDDDDFCGHACAPVCQPVYRRVHYPAHCQPVHRSYYHSACQPVRTYKHVVHQPPAAHHPPVKCCEPAPTCCMPAPTCCAPVPVCCY